MALSDYEEFVVAELEAQFRADDDPEIPHRSFARLALPVAFLLTGAGLLVAAHDVGLGIRISDFWGFSTSSVTAVFAFTAHALLLGSAFLLGRGLYETPGRRPVQVGSQTPVMRSERVQSP